MSSIDLRSILPVSRSWDASYEEFRENSHLVLAAGSEDRGLGFLHLLSRSKRRPGALYQGVSLLNYAPHDAATDHNKKEILRLLKKGGLKPLEYSFDSGNPGDFLDTAEQIIKQAQGASHIYLDISVMSKLLILYLLNAFWKNNTGFSVIYSEAKRYRPSLSEYRRSLGKGHFGQDIGMEFLFSGVFEPIIPRPFVGRAPLGRPRALITFLGFNKRQAIGAAAIVPYQLFVPVVSVPPNPKWKWREKALIRINNYGLLASGQRIGDIPELKRDKNGNYSIPKGEYRLHLSTFDYVKTVQALSQLSIAHRYTHFLTIAPFGSKLQALGVFIFTRIRRETQIVYASPRDFHPRYSEGIKATHEIKFLNPLQLERELIKALNPNFTVLAQISDFAT
jgi:hypothetical protein